MAHAVGMHPLLTTAAILVFGQVGGFWGTLFGIPLAATLSQLAPPALRLLHSYLAGGMRRGRSPPRTHVCKWSQAPTA